MNRLALEKSRIANENDFQLVLHKLCPFAHRAWIAALEKQCKFSTKFVSLQFKEGFFNSTYLQAYGRDPNSTGKVPILIQGQNIFCQSQLICWHLAQRYETGTQLIPIDHAQRLKMRWFISTFSSKVIAAFYMILRSNAKSEEQKAKALEKTDKIFQEFEDNLRLPYICGDQFTLADIMVYPWFERSAAIGEVVGYSAGTKFQKINQWIKNVQERPSIKATKQTNQYYMKVFQV